MHAVNLVTHERESGLKMVGMETQKPLFCQTCLEMFYSETQLDKHMKIHEEPKCHEPKYEEPKNEEPKYECFKCNKKFRTNVTLQRHISTHTLQERKFPCNFCDEKGFSLKELALHEWRHTASKDYPCQVCDMSRIILEGPNVLSCCHTKRSMGRV